MKCTTTAYIASLDRTPTRAWRWPPFFVVGQPTFPATFPHPPARFGVAEGGEWKDENHPVWLDWTPCNLGGQRPWFRYPARGCGRRVAILYGGGIFACRHCYRLAYPSQRETWDDRAARRADRIRNKLGWEPGILNGKELKPKGMHWRTFERLTAKHDTFVEQSLAGMAQRFGFKL